MKDLKAEIETLKSTVDSMSNFKVDPSKRGQEMYVEYRTRCEDMIEKLRSEGAKEETHPVFAQAVTSFNYWK